MALMKASVSPYTCRRSEWPRSTTRAPTSLTIAADTSPVNAPEGSSEQFWAPTRTWEPAQTRATSSTWSMAGKRPTSTPSAAWPRMASASSTAERRSMFIFQLPAT